MQKRDSSKVCQSKLKEQVATWAKCAVSFQVDKDAINTLLGNLKNQFDTYSSVSKTLITDSRSPLMQYDNLKTLLLSKITIELETTLNLIKSYTKGMGDVFIALQFASNDANLILTQNQIKDIGCVTPILLETVLDIQNLQILNEIEYIKKKKLISSLLINGNSNSNSNSYGNSSMGMGMGMVVKDITHILSENVLRKCIEGWEETNDVYKTTDKLLLESIIESNVNANNK